MRSIAAASVVAASDGSSLVITLPTALLALLAYDDSTNCQPADHEVKYSIKLKLYSFDLLGRPT